MRTRTRTAALLLGLAASVLVACSTADDATTLPAPGSPEVAMTLGDDAAPKVVSADRSITRTAWITLRVGDLLGTSRQIGELAEERGGMVVAEDSGSMGTDPYATITVKVPSDALDGFLATLTTLGTQVSSSVSAVDITAQVNDVDARIATLEASTQRMRELLDEATAISDIIAIEAELGAREAELDGLLAQQRVLDDQVAMSSVTVSLTPEVSGVQASAPGFIAGLQSGWNALRSAAEWLTTSVGFALPFIALVLLITAVIALPVRRVIRRRSVSHRRDGDRASE